MLHGWRVAVLAVLAAWMYVVPQVAAVGDAAAGLFPVDHENVTFLNDANFYQHVTGDVPWIVNFYSPMCSHCRSFAPAYVEIAAHFKATDPRVHVGAISCVDNLLCRRLEVNGYPQLVYFNFGKSGENKRGRGGSGPSSVYAAVKELFQAADAQPPSDATKDVIDSTASPTPTPLPPLWTASLASTTLESRLLDAASAIVYGFKHELFAASEGNLSSDELGAFKQWLWLLQSTFPGRHNRAALKTIYDDVSARAELNMATWHALLDAWQSRPVGAPVVSRSNDQTPPAWHELNRLFQTDGKSYRACHGYTCGLWMVIHMAAHQAAAKSADDCVRIYQAIRGYVATFMTCETCRAHFTAANPPTLQTKSPAALQLWAYNMHASVNSRVRHPTFPSPADCPRCAADTGAVLRFLDAMYAYPDPADEPASGDAAWMITLVGVAAGVVGVGGVVFMVWWLRPQRGGRALPRFQKERVA